MFSFAFWPPPTHGKGFCPLGGIGKHTMLCAGGCGKMPQSSREGRATGRGAKKDRFSGLCWVKGYRKAVEGGQHTGHNPSLFQSLKRHAETSVKSSTGAMVNCLQQAGSRPSTGSVGHVLPGPPARGLCRRGGTRGPRGWWVRPGSPSRGWGPHTSTRPAARSPTSYTV